MTKSLKGFRERFAKNFLDVLVLRLIQMEPMWGYKILKKIEELFDVKIRHGALYPLLKSLEATGFLKSRKDIRGRRIRKVYEITTNGVQFLDSYYNFLREQIRMSNIRDKETMR